MFDFPALLESAETLSAKSQQRFFFLIAGEMAALLLAAILAMEWSKAAGYYAVYALVFFVSLGVVGARTWLKPEQQWYKGRALAESIKTSCWRYCMGAEPFGYDDVPDATRAEFRSHLREILEANRHIGYLTPTSSTADQITKSMEEVRSKGLVERIALYRTSRVDDQETWYSNKARANERSVSRWTLANIASYALAIALVLFRVANPDLRLWPIEPVIVLASSISGWIQVRKFNELASAYSLTAHEIGILKSKLPEITTEIRFDEFVNEAEQAFSREHTQWVARQQTA